MNVATNTEADPVLMSATNLTIKYGRVEAVRGVNLQVKHGQIVTIIGPNGAGKTTLLNGLMGLLAVQGDLTFFNERTLDQPTTEALVRRGVALIPETRELFTTMTVEDNLLLGAFTRYRNGERDIHETLNEVYEFLPRLRERKSQTVNTLSGGERQMLAMGRALMSKPKLLMLDEPSLGLAPLVTREILAAVARLRDLGMSCLLVEQNARAALRIADFAYVMESGAFIMQGPAADIASNQDVINSYLGVRSAASEPCGRIVTKLQVVSPDQARLEIDTVPVWQEVARALADAGAKRCFGLVGGANFKVTHELTRLDVRFIAARHEGGAITMADAAARLAKDLNIVSVTSGPGLTNAITGIGEATKSDTPLIVIAGDVPLGDEKSSFAIRQAELVGSVGAYWVQINKPEQAYDDTLKAAVLAQSRRKVVVLSLPIDTQEALTARHIDNGECAIVTASANQNAAPQGGQISALANLIARSQRPLILAGHGAGVSDAEGALMTLADQVGALLATSLQAHGMFASHPWSLGISGGFASPAAMQLIAQSDLIIVFGASLNMWTTHKGELTPASTTVVQVDSDAARFGRFRDVGLEIEGDASAVAIAVLTELASRGSTAQTRWRNAETADIIAAKSHRNTSFRDTGTADCIDPRTLTKALDDILPRDRVVVLDGGHFTGWPIHHLSVPDAASWCIPIAFQSIGLGLAASIGASIVSPDRLVVLAVGDGGFLMSVAELETAVRLKLRLCIIVYNDAAYSAEVHHFKGAFALDIVQFPTTDFARLARGFGAGGTVVRNLADLSAVREWIDEGASGVFVIDARINPDLAADWYCKAVGSSNL